MPRSKNPNPRQLVDGEGDISQDNPDENSSQSDERNDAERLHTDGACAAAEEKKNESSLVIGKWMNSDNPTPAQECQTEPDVTSFQGESSPVAVASSPSDNNDCKELVPYGRLSIANEAPLIPRQNESRRTKSISTAVLNPKVMTWMKNRFCIGDGSKISASDISKLFSSDTKGMEDTPSGLQNYQVGQLLRRVFPNITRCKITVSGKRFWVYKHLVMNPNPPDDLFEEQPLEMTDEEEDPDQMGAGASESPISNVEDGVEDDRDDLSLICSQLSDDKEKNALLLGLLGGEEKSATSNDDLPFGQNIGGSVKKRRDDEVMDWLTSCYKYKPGYFVKSMDLLRNYNNGRPEMVKYLSQVGRVMKQVFPLVTHFRKSFKGGKREWVYLHLKPIDVDSDSEEGRKMIMPASRRTGNCHQCSESPTMELQRRFTSTRGDRAEVSHASLSHGENMFNKQDVFKVKPISGGNKLRISKRRREYDVPSMVHWARTECKEEVMDDDIDLHNSEKHVNHGFHAAHDRYSPNQPCSSGSMSMPAKRFKTYMPNLGSVPTVTNHSLTSEARITGSKHFAEVNPNGIEAFLLNPSGSSFDPYSPVLDLSMKGANGCDSGDERNDVMFASPNVLPNIVPRSHCGDVTTRNMHANSACAASKFPGGASTPPTLHYHPMNHIQKSNHNGSSSNPEISSSSSTRHFPDGQDDAHTPLCWRSVQTFNAQRYGWMRPPVSSNVQAKENGKTGKKPTGFVEWFLVCGQSLVNRQRALKEFKIHDDWTVEIHALGRRIDPEKLGIAHLERTSGTLDKVFKALTELKVCAGFPARSANDLYVQGIMVAKFEVWSSRENEKEDWRHKAVNCQIMYSGTNPWCNGCARVFNLREQEKKGILVSKRTNQCYRNT